MIYMHTTSVYARVVKIFIEIASLKRGYYIFSKLLIPFCSILKLLLP